MKYFKSERVMYGEIFNMEPKDIDTVEVFKLLKIFFKEFNLIYDEALLELGITKVKQGINDVNTLKYVYSYGASLIQAMFSIKDDKTTFYTIKLLN